MTDKTASDILRIAVAQLNPTVGDVAGNLAKAREARADAARQGADIVLFTELFLAGYPPEDLVLKPAFLKACERAAQDFARDTADGGPGVIIGTPLKRKSGTHNSIIVADGGKILAERYKLDLPNYGEFDEKRVFQAGPDMPGPVNFRGVRLGIPICEDIWGDLGVCETLAESGAEILLVPNGSPYYRGKVDVRQQVAIRQVIESGLPLLWANQLGGQDELIFDGASFAIQADKSLAFQMSQFEETLVVTEWKRTGETWICVDGPMSRIPEKDEADYRACMLGLRDYVNKNGFKNVVLGLSGGIDSAICATLAVDALGPERLCQRGALVHPPAAHVGRARGRGGRGTRASPQRARPRVDRLCPRVSSSLARRRQAGRARGPAPGCHASLARGRAQSADRDRAVDR